MWKFISKLWILEKKNKKLSHPEVLTNTNGVEVRGLQAVANIFSNYFAGVSQSFVSAGIDLSPSRSHKQYLPPTESTSIFLAPVSFAEFQKIIKNLKNSISVGHDEPSTNLLEYYWSYFWTTYPHFEFV